MIEKNDSQLSIRKQAALLGVNRNRLEPASRTREEDERLMKEIDRLHLEMPSYGSRRIRAALRRAGWEVGRDRVRRLMRTMGIRAIVPKPRTTQPGKAHKKYPYLLGEMEVSRPDEAWCADITYLPMHRGYGYLVAVMDWRSRAVLGWRISNTLDTSFCVEAFRDAVSTAGCTPEIFNTDQGCQFTSKEWLEELESHAELKVSMDGKGRWMDNVFIERLWWSLKYEDVYLKEYRDLFDLEAGVSKWIQSYNLRRLHQSLGYRTPWEIYRPLKIGKAA